MEMEYEGRILSAPGMNSMFPDPPKHTSDYSSTILIKKLPCLGRIHFVNDRAGILTLSFTVLYWIYGTFVSMFIIIMPRYNDGLISVLVPLVFMFISIGCIVSLLRSALTNPGRVPLLEDISSQDTDDWEFCHKCQRKRPKRAHHCRRCQQCVLRMDHHCPWINNCVGKGNHWAFFQLTLYAFLLSWSAFFLCMLHFWYFPACVRCDQEWFFLKHSIWFTYLLTVMGVFMGMFMGANIAGQHINLLLDRTTLENIISAPDPSKLQLREVLMAYREVCGVEYILCWLNPCRRRPLSSYSTTSYHVSPV